ncbi:MAG: hypothetical protein G01um101424_261 [Parcubacteria group bacterium Gr01-1014_24]|nr:MAG: hypothetical protein G01um101424_261 [Parcubacteria group bacterium Gr01-1014_24]
MNNKGFISIPIIVAIVIISLTGGLAVRHQVQLSKKKMEATLPTPPTITPYRTLNTSSDKPDKPDKSPPVQSQSSVSESPVRKTDTVVNIQQEFALIEGEVRGVEEKKSFFSPEHVTRILSNLANLETRGYPKGEIEKLRQMVHNFSSYLEDQKKQNQVAPPAYVSTAERNCESNLSPVFTNDITDISRVNYIGPPPTMGAGPSLKTHSYIGTDHARVPVYAPAAMTLESGAHYIGGPYVFEFQMSCEVKVRFGHITEPVDAIKQLLPSEPKEGSQTQELTPVKFAAGDLVAYTTGTNQAGNWDFGVYNSTVRNRYADDPDWSNSTTYTTAVCPFDYFSVSLKPAYFSKFNSAILGGNPPHGTSFCGT